MVLGLLELVNFQNKCLSFVGNGVCVCVTDKGRTGSVGQSRQGIPTLRASNADPKLLCGYQLSTLSSSFPSVPSSSSRKHTEPMRNFRTVAISVG